MALGGRPGPAAAGRKGASARSAGASTNQVALFASALQPSDAPTAAMAAAAITATVGRLGSQGCVSRMAQEFGDHPDAAAERMRWIIQLTAGMPARPPGPARTGHASSRAGDKTAASSADSGAANRLGTAAERHCTAQRREEVA